MLTGLLCGMPQRGMERLHIVFHNILALAQAFLPKGCSCSLTLVTLLLLVQPSTPPQILRFLGQQLPVRFLTETMTVMTLSLLDNVARRRTILSPPLISTKSRLFPSRLPWLIQRV